VTVTPSETIALSSIFYVQTTLYGKHCRVQETLLIRSHKDSHQPIPVTTEYPSLSRQSSGCADKVTAPVTVKENKLEVTLMGD
jgi:hypothetical protein